MFRLGLTGSMATGKSFALSAFGELGLPTCSADAVVHRLYEGDAVEKVEALFPGVAVAGRVDRAELSRRLVAAPGRLAELEAVVHPLVRRDMLAFLAEAEAGGADIAVLEIPLLFESANAYPLDAVAVTVCEPAEQRRRALSREGMSGEKFEAILARQLPQDEKKRRADFVIDTAGSYDETRAQIRAIVERIRRRVRGQQE